MNEGVCFNRQPLLESDLLTLRPLVEGDFDALYQVASDPLVWALHPAIDRHTRPVFRAYFEQAIVSGGALVTIDNQADCIIGTSRFHGFNQVQSEIEIGWTFLGRRWWGGRYNREMKRLMLDHAFQRVERVVFIVGGGNLRSQAAVRKIGAEPIADRTDSAGVISRAFAINRAQFQTHFYGVA